MRTVFTNSMCAHAWASQSQEHGHSDSMRFQKGKLYSYAACIGHIVTRKGQTAVLLTERRWSVTTSTHQRLAAYATSNLQQFYVADLGDYGAVNHKENLKDYACRILKLAVGVQRARSHKDWKLQALKDLVKEANDYAKFFGLKKKFKVPSDFDLKAEEKRAREEAQKDAQRREQARLESERRFAEQQERDLVQMEAWLVGQAEDFPYSWIGYNKPIRLRVKDDKIETSLGAEVPLSHCKRMLQAVRSGVPFQANGHAIKVGLFHIDSISEDGTITAGCHTIRKEEIERLAAQLGW